MKNPDGSPTDKLNIHDVFWYVVYCWKTVLLIALVSAVLLALTEGLYLVRMRKAQQEAKQIPQTVPSENIPEGKAAILEQTESVTVQAGTDAVFFVRTAGKVTRYRWQFSRDGISWSNLSVNTYPSAGADTLILKTTPTHNNYAFRCSITFDDETVLISREIPLKVTTYAEPLTEITKHDVVNRTVKYGVAGCLLGALGGILTLVAVFSLRGYPVNGLAVQRRYGTDCFGVLRQDGHNRFVERVLDNLTYEKAEEDTAKLIAARMEPHVEKDQPILLVGTVSAQTLNQVAKAVQPGLFCEVIPAGDLQLQAEAVLAAASIKRVVCVEQILKSRGAAIDRELEALKNIPAECIGFILTE